MKADQISRKGVLADEELALLVQKGDTDAFSVLSYRYDAALKGRAGRYVGIAGVEAEDFFQEGLIALYRAARGYNPNGKARFRTYAVACINNSMTTAIKLHMRQQNCKKLLSIQQLDEAIMSQQPMEHFLLDQEDLSPLIDRIQSRLSKLERQVLHHYLTGHSYQQISRVLGTSPKTVDNALQRVRRKLRLHP
ncbi:MAG: sigma-70 family RNA polymerase sigma factor [Oscillospiraceae bacterium]|jgi:RNA polymerase sporulation-specific sigma factor